MLEIYGRKVQGLKVDLPTAPLLVIVAPRGYVMCGYLDITTAERLGQAAAVVKGVKTFADVLKGKVAAATSEAKKIGVSEGMLVIDALRKMI